MSFNIVGTEHGNRLDNTGISNDVMWIELFSPVFSKTYKACRDFTSLGRERA